MAASQGRVFLLLVLRSPPRDRTLLVRSLLPRFVQYAQLLAAIMQHAADGLPARSVYADDQVASEPVGSGPSTRETSAMNGTGTPTDGGLMIDHRRGSAMTDLRSTATACPGTRPPASFPVRVGRRAWIRSVPGSVSTRSDVSKEDGTGFLVSRRPLTPRRARVLGHQRATAGTPAGDGSTGSLRILALVRRVTVSDRWVGIGGSAMGP
ncbi:MAG: hypothetical protein NZL87_02820 [Thermomicrobium sp.]|nr:hypothetical protein [Thermomicrobium sp.]